MPEDEREGVWDIKRGGRRARGALGAAGKAEQGDGRGRPGRGQGSEQVNMWREEKKATSASTCDVPEGEGERRRDGSENSVQKDLRKGWGGSAV